MHLVEDKQMCLPTEFLSPCCRLCQPKPTPGTCSANPLSPGPAAILSHRPLSVCCCFIYLCVCLFGLWLVCFSSKSTVNFSMVLSLFSYAGDSKTKLPHCSESLIILNRHQQGLTNIYQLLIPCNCVLICNFGLIS